MFAYLIASSVLIRAVRDCRRNTTLGHVCPATLPGHHARSTLRSCQTGTLLTSLAAEPSIPTGVAARGVSAVRANIGRNPAKPTSFDRGRFRGVERPSLR